MQSPDSMEQRRGRRQFRRLSLLVAVLVVGLLVGTLAVTLDYLITYLTDPRYGGLPSGTGGLQRSEEPDPQVRMSSYQLPLF